MLFVGCGGSGVKTVRMIRRRIENHLRFSGYSGAFPRAWQFLAIDVPTIDDSSAELRAVDGVRYVGLTESHATYRGDSGADRHLVRSPGWAEFLQWRPNPSGVSANIVKGASQQRAVGRVVVTTFADKVQQAIQQAVEECTNNMDGLMECAHGMGHRVVSTTEFGTPMVVLVSSLGGGAGSGMFLDVADMLRMSARAGDHWLRGNLCAVLYDPSVFEDDGVDARGGISPNSLAAISEVVAGQWHPWAPSDLLGEFVGDLGSFGGPEFTFLIGSGNGTMNLRDADQVYEATADALATWVTNDDLGTDIDAFVFGNWGESPVTSKSPLHGGAASRLPLSSFGLSRVTVGNKRFAEYAERRIVNAAVESLLRRPRSAVETFSGSLGEAAKARVAEDDYGLVARFLNRCGLNEDSPEGGDSNDQVINAIRDTQELKREVASLVETVKGRLNDPENLYAHAKGAGDTEFSGRPALFRDKHRLRAIEWSESIQSKVIEETLEELSREGLAVTIEILGEVKERLASTFPSQLASEAAALRNKDPWSTLANRLSSFNAKRKQGVPTEAKKVVGTLFENRLKLAIEADLRVEVAGVLADMANNFIAPLIASLEDAQHALTEARARGEVQSASDKSVPDDLKPSPAEVMLVETKRFAPLYDELLTKTSQSVEEAVRDVLCAHYGLVRSYERAAEHLHPFAMTPWRPALHHQLPEELNTGRTPAKASINVRLTVPELTVRADHWLAGDVDTPVGAFIAKGIRDWITDPDVGENERQQRGQDLATKLDKAFNLAAPLIERNMQWIGQVLGVPAGNGGVNTWDVIVPLAEGDAGFDEVTQVLQRRLGSIDVSRCFVNRRKGTRRQDSIELFTVLAPLPPSAFASLVHPVVTNWRASVEDHPYGDGNFWRHRRARPLMDALPLHEHTRACLARGWTTARILDAVEWPDYESAATISVDGVTKQFTYPPLPGQPAEVDDEFGHLLETAILSEFLAAAGEPEGYEALMLLMSLGSSDGRAEATESYRRLHPALAEFVDAMDDPVTDGEQLADDLDAFASSLRSMKVQRPREPREWDPFPAYMATAALQAEAMHTIASAIRRHVAPTTPKTGSKRFN